MAEDDNFTPRPIVFVSYFSPFLQMLAIYEKYAPEKLSFVDVALVKYEGRWGSMLQASRVQSRTNAFFAPYRYHTVLRRFALRTVVDGSGAVVYAVLARVVQPKVVVVLL